MKFQLYTKKKKNLKELYKSWNNDVTLIDFRLRLNVNILNKQIVSLNCSYNCFKSQLGEGGAKQKS